ncbi:hypothetical protein F4808DRAFT_456411 [Astrocystis sublimbata]|nr:hypothetical protein F4808DRAFT_456411 [Astrocystis sublimbata]
MPFRIINEVFKLSQTPNTGKPSAIGWKKSEAREYFSTGARLSEASTSLPAKKDIATNACKNSPPSQSQSQSQSPPSSQIDPSPPEEEFHIRFRDLGMNRITKFVVFVVIGVLGTMESVFWCKVLWRWWTRNEEDTDVKE